jgi:hypothetical protein|tara:strand:+ start:5675 stop:5944 length:270 start_codon:yes stop_codon:yes gene_type:complete
VKEHQGQNGNTDAANVNPFNELGFWQFTLVSTLTVALLPWSLLGVFLLFGSQVTKNLASALVQDFAKTLAALLLGAGLIVGLVVWVFWY